MIKNYLQQLNTYDNIIPLLLFVFIASFFVSFVTFRPLLNVIIKKKLHDEPNSRSAHIVSTPTIGGVAIYISLVLVISLFGAVFHIDGLLILIGCLTCLFFAGLNDDLTNLNPLKKAVIQILVAFFIVAVTDIRIIGFSGILGIEILPYWISIGFTIFVYMLVVNAFNLIDGVDGLASSLAIMACVGLSYLFWVSKQYTLTALCFSLIGAILPFLRLNLSKKRKIFMGGSGSMIIGFTIAYCTINFISKTQLDPNSSYYLNTPILAVALLFYPLIDTLRIFFIRMIINRTSPFKADRNHIHHKFLDRGYSHKATTFIILVLNTIVFCIVFFLKPLSIHMQLLTIIGLGVFIFTIPFMINKKKP